MKHHCHVALVVLVISIMIIPPFGRNFLSGATMKEGVTTGKDTHKPHPTRITGKTLSPVAKQTEEQMHKQACTLAKMTIGELGQLANMKEGNISNLPAEKQAHAKALHQQGLNLKEMTVSDLCQTLQMFGIEKCHSGPH